MNELRYEDAYDYELMRTCAAGKGLSEIELMDLHNHLVWRDFHPRENSMCDEIVCECILKASKKKRVPLFAVRDEKLNELIDVLFA